jgi:hypothetical protein
MNQNLIIIPLVGVFLWNINHDGPMTTTNPHTVEPPYQTQTLYSVTTPLTGSCPTEWTS